MRWTIYKSSGLATFVSIVGALVVYAGILGLLAREFLVGFICIVIGFGTQMGAAEIVDNATFKKWKMEIISKGYAQLIAQGDYSVAVQLYNQNPGKKTIQYFETLNPQIASRLAASVQSAAGQRTASAGNQGTSSETKAARPAPKPAPEQTKPVQTAAAPAASGKSIELPAQLPQNECCTGCGAELVPNSKFCSKCGSKVEQAKTCPRCCNKLSKGAKFCGKCGYQIQ